MLNLKNPYIGKHFVKRKSFEPTEKYRDYNYRRQPNLIYAKDTFNVGKKLIDKEGYVFNSCPMYTELLKKRFDDGQTDNNNKLFSSNSMPKSEFNEMYEQIVEQKQEEEEKKRKHPLPSVEVIRQELIKIIAFHEKQEESYFASVYPLPGCLNADSDSDDHISGDCTHFDPSKGKEKQTSSLNKKFDNTQISYVKGKHTPLAPNVSQHRQKPIKSNGAINLAKTSKRKYKFKNPMPTKRRKRSVANKK